MKRLACLLALTAGLVATTTSWAGTTGYAGPRFWWAGDTGASTYSSSWWRNAFNKQSSGFDTTVTFIDNVQYWWHSTVRNTSMVTYTTWWSSQTKKAHCRAHQSGFNGGCWVTN